MNNPRLKSVVLLATIAAVVAGVSLYVLARPSPTPPHSSVAFPAPSISISPAATFVAATTQPKITWSTTSINVILSPGDSTSSNFTFTSTSSLQNVAIQAVSAIAGFLTIQPSVLARVPANQPQSVHISFAIPPGTTLGTYTGTIHIRIGDQTLPQTLKVTVSVWNNFESSTVGIRFKYPSLASRTRVTETRHGSDTSSVLDVQVFDDAKQEFASVFALAIYSNPSGVGLQQWFHDTIDPDDILGSAGTFQQQQLQSGVVVLMRVAPVPSNYLAGNGPVEELFMLSPSLDRVVSIMQSEDPQLSQFGFTQQGVSDLFKQVLGTVQFF